MNPNQKLRDGNHGGEGGNKINRGAGNMAFYGAGLDFEISMTGRKICVL